MCNDILKLLKIKDENIQVHHIDEDVKVRGQLSTVIYGTLSYLPESCMYCTNKDSKQIHKHGKRVSRLTLLKSQESIVYFNLAKQRFKCQCCQKTFTAQTDVVDEHCFISNRVKLAIQDKLTQVRSEKDIAADCCVSPSTVNRCIQKSFKSLSVKPSSGLPRHISMDEFKSVKHVTTVMSFLFINNETNQIIDILEDRRIYNLKEYFYRFDRRERLAVETVTIDMYEPYIHFIKEVFPNATIIFDRFHIVQHLNRELNKYRVSVMNGCRYSTPKDYTKLKNHWKLLLMNRQEINSYEYYRSRSFKTYVTSRDVLDYLLNLDDNLPQNAVFIANDFLDIADYETVRKNLNRMVDKKEIERVLKGIYHKPKYIEIIDEYEIVDTNEVAKAIARKYHWTIAPSGNTALNLLGLSTQVPSKWVYISDGRYVEYTFGNTTIAFKKTRNSDISHISTHTATVIQAIKTLGEDRITEQHIERLRDSLDPNDKKQMLEEGKMTATWIYRIIKKIVETE